ncbi:hypothetical protein [Xanthomonas arboricola]|uniref:hypothetical protein n=1 Tax=Xanthomonas arboricola TaxID=56448 RepID=UPI0011B07073|nr:hypothetical protein [Xanthomonas arboricola]
MYVALLQMLPVMQPVPRGKEDGMLGDCVYTSVDNREELQAWEHAFLMPRAFKKSDHEKNANVFEKNFVRTSKIPSMQWG